MTYIGIDNGITGGVVALGPCAGTGPIYAAKMPLLNAPDGSQEIDAVELYRMLDRNSRDVTVIVEECPKHAKSTAAMRSMAISYGIILAVLRRCQLANGWKIRRVKSGNALEGWQRQMLGNVPRGQTKKRAREVAKSIWPDETWIAPCGRVPHTGLLDAALIAEFGRRKYEPDAPGC